MHPATVELMRDQVHAIYRAVTGNDLVEPEPSEEASKAEPNVALEDVTRRFIELDAMARGVPAVVQRVPPFSFAPPVDVLDEGQELLIEVAVPGVEREDVSVECKGDVLVVSGLRRGERAANGRVYMLAEIPRGPFERTLTLPFPVEASPRFEVEHGVVLIHLRKASPKRGATEPPLTEQKKSS